MPSGRSFSRQSTIPGPVPGGKRRKSYESGNTGAYCCAQEGDGKEGVDYYMVPTADFHNSEYVDQYFKMREYLSGFTGSNGTLVVSAGEAGLWTDGRYFIQAENELKGTGIRLFRMLDEGVPTIQEYLQANMKEGQTLGFDGRVVDTAFGCRLEKALSDKKIIFAYDKDLADEVWADRPGCQATRS